MDPGAEGSGAADEVLFWGDPNVVGRILDPEGRPLAGVPLYLGLADPASYVRSDQGVLSAAGADIEGGRAVARIYSSGVVTDAAGRFEFDLGYTRRMSSGDGRVSVVPADPAWMEPKAHRAEEGGDVVVDRAASLTVRIVGEAMTSLPECHVLVREESRRGENAFVAKNGGFVVQWRRAPGLPEAVEASLVVWARGRRTDRRVVSIPAGRAGAEVTIDLGPLQEDARMLLDGVSPAERTVVVLSFPEKPDDPVESVLLSLPDGAARLAAGRFRTRVLASSGDSSRLLLDEEITFRAGETVERRLEPRR
jgi:hypothetical protein